MTGIIDTTQALSVVLDAIEGLPTNPPSLYIDLEGVKLSRYGSISILQLHIFPTSQTYLIDIKTLGSKVFSTSGSSGRTFQDVLESQEIQKVIFDVRRDSDALFSHFNVRLEGIQDLQLMELATRSSRKSHVNGLSKCIEKDLSLSSADASAFKATKEKGLKLFDPKLGGSYEVFNERPISEEVRKYCIEDVKYLPLLWACYNRKLTPQWRAKVHTETKARIALSQTANFNGDGKHMALAPSGWSYI
ncbi:ribonuclease H-like domain-containing protein [Hypoxylon sp. FL0890]|nr:ribonuclease H-like domain-containing protein [Hypoxylon sp. FL0890]